MCPMSGHDHAHCSRCGAEKTSRYCDKCDAAATTYVYADEDCHDMGWEIVVTRELVKRMGR